jgi:hypothetical protein
VEHDPNQHGGNGHSAGGATAELTAIVCPYCGADQAPSDRCAACGGVFEPLSRQASQNQMGPWQIRDERHPFRPGCSYGTLRRLVAKGAVRRDTVLRGPTSRQFWARAIHVPGVAHLLGECHNCREAAGPDDYMCASCGVVFSVPEDRQFLGLGPVRLLPGQAPPEIVARSSLAEQRESPTRPETTPEPAPGPARPRTPSAERPATMPRAQTPGETRDMSPAEAASVSPMLRRQNRKIGQLRLVVGALVVLNLVLLLLLAVAASPRLRFGAGEAVPGDAPQTESAPATTPATEPE